MKRRQLLWVPHMTQVIVAPFLRQAPDTPVCRGGKMLKNSRKLLIVLLTFSLSGCHTISSKYSLNPSFQTGDLKVERQHGINKPEGKIFPLANSIATKPNGLGTWLYLGGPILGIMTVISLKTVPPFAIVSSLLGPIVDLAITPFTFLHGYKHFDTIYVDGTLQGKIHETGKSIPATPPITLVIGSEATPIKVDTDGHFTLPFNLQKEFQANLINFSLVFPWKETFAETGEVLKPTPDTLEYTLSLKSDKSIELVDSSTRPLSSLEITLAYEEMRDESRIKEAAKEKKIADENRKKEKIAEDKLKKEEKITEEKHVVSQIVGDFLGEVQGKLIGMGAGLVIMKNIQYSYQWLNKNRSRFQADGTCDMYAPNGMLLNQTNWAVEAWKDTNGVWQHKDKTRY